MKKQKTSTDRATATNSRYSGSPDGVGAHCIPLLSIFKWQGGGTATRINSYEDDTPLYWGKTLAKAASDVSRTLERVTGPVWQELLVEVQMHFAAECDRALAEKPITQEQLDRKAKLKADYERDPWEGYISAHIADNIGPRERDQNYGNRLGEALKERDLGKITGGGCSIGDGGVDLSIEVKDVEASLEFVRDTLRGLGAPLGSTLQFKRDGKMVTIPIHQHDCSAETSRDTERG